MANQLSLNEFAERARTLCNTPSRNLRKEAENFFQTSRSQSTDITFQICLDILVHTVSTQERVDLAPEVLLASQTLCWICKHKPVPGQQMQAVSELLVLLAVRGYHAKHPLVVQITSAVSAVLLTSNLRIGCTGACWSSSVVQSMFALAAERNINTELWVSYILSVLSTMPEIVGTKEVILLVCASSNLTQSVAADASVLKNLLVAGELLRETHTVEHTAVQAVAFATTSGASGGSADFLADIMRCGTLWVNFAAQTLQTRLPAATSAETVVPIFTTAVESVHIWHRSSLVSTAMNYLQCGHTGVGTEACLEMCVALCNAVDLGDNAVPNSAHPVEAHLRSVASSLALQLLPALSVLLAAACAVCKDVLILHTSHKNDAARVEAVLEKCLLLTRSAAECATALLPRAFKPLFAHGVGAVTTEVLSVSSIWMAFLNMFQQTIQTISHSTHALQREVQEQDCEITDVVCAHRQQMLEIGLSFASDLAEATNAASLTHSNTAVSTELAALTNTVNVAVEIVLVAAVRASAYNNNIHACMRQEGNGEEFDEFRNYVRDCLRLLVTSLPSLALWLVNHTVQSIGTLTEQIHSIVSANQSGTMIGGFIGVDWSMCEALLHALTAITKHIQSQVRSPTGASLLSTTVQLANLLVTEDVCCACRPISRMCVVFYAELTPIFLDLLLRLTLPATTTTTTSTKSAVVTTFVEEESQAQVQLVVQAVRVMILRLILSLYHPEAPFNSQHTLPVCIAAVRSVSDTRLFLLTPGGVNVDYLCLEGSYIPFRVKQDHIGAVSLQKAISAMLTHIVQHPQHGEILGCSFSNGSNSREDLNAGLISQVPNIVNLIQEAQGCMSQQQSVPASILHIRHHAFLNNDNSDGLAGNNIAQTLLCLTFAHLTSYQRLDGANQALTEKSFQLQQQALFACLLFPPHPTSLTAQSIVQNIGALLAPVSAAIAHILAHRAGAAENMQVLAYVSHCCRLLGGTEGEASISAVTELSQLLCAQCSLSQLFSLLSALIQETRLTCDKASAPIANAYYSALLCIIETCVPLQEMLVHAARQKNLSLSDIETEALCGFLSACNCMEYVAMAVTSESALRAPALLLSLQEQYFSVLREENAGIKRQLLLPVPLVAIKAVSTWNAVADITELFHRIVSEVSIMGVQIAHEEKMNQLQRATAGTSVNKGRNKGGEDQNGAFFVLLQFWNVCLSRTVLLPTTAAAAVTTKKSGKNTTEAIVKLSFDALGWNTLDCILAQVCRNFEVFCLEPSTEQLTHCFCLGQVDGWEAALAVITLSLGPLYLAMTNASASVLDTDGRVTVGALKEATCSSDPAGEPELVNWLVTSGNAEQISRALLFALLQSTSALSASVSISPHGPEPQVRYFPSELREDCIACLVKLVLCLGTARVSVSLNQALQHTQCPRNGVLGAQTASAAAKVTQWVEKWLAQGKAGDWKKFKSHAKTLCRG